MMSENDTDNLDLSQFEEKIKPQDQNSLDITAYRMDTSSSKHMASYAGLGTLHCCDYLHIRNNEAIFIEDTHLGLKIKDLKTTHDNIQYIKKFLRLENTLKVYGTVLILCKLSQRYKNIADTLRNKKFSFWLVIDDEEDIKAMDTEIIPFLKNKLSESLEGGLGGAKILKKVEILVLKELEARLQQKIQ